MFNSLRNRLTILFIGLAVIPLILASTFIGLRNFDTLGRQAVATQRDKADLVGAEVQSFILQREGELQILTSVRGLSGLPLDEQRGLLNSLLAHESSYQGLALLDSTGQETIRVSRTDISSEADLISRSNEEVFSKPISTGEVYFSPVQYREEFNEPFLTLGVPVVDPVSGQISAVLVADLRFKAVWNLFGTLDYVGDEDIFMTDKDGQVVAHRNPSVVLRGTTFLPPAEDGRTKGLSSDDVVLATDTIHLGEQVFTVVAEQPYRQASAVALNTIMITTVTIAVALIVAVILVFVTVRQIVTPIENLSETAELIGKGDLSQRAQVNSKDEIGVLAESFNSMTSQLTETLEMERVARLEAQEASRAKDLFLATMSHELRTPLNAMIGFLGLMLYSEQLDDDNVHMAERSIANAERLLSLINNILDLSRITVGRLEIIPAEVQPEQLAKAIEDDMALRFKEKDLDLVVEVDQRLPTMIVHDEERLIQIATNLIGNAIKFTDEGEVRMSLLRNSDRLIVKVADTGIGIPTSKQQIIFDEFTQVDSSSTRNYGGAGLGLSIVKQLAILMRGSVSVDSTMGEGSTFTVDLPLNLEDPQHEEKRGNLELVAQGA